MVIVFFATNSIKNSSSPTPTPVILVITATSPVNTPIRQEDPTKPPAATATKKATAQNTNTATVPPTATKEPTAQPTQAVITDPSGTIPADMPVLVDGLALTVSAQDVQADGKMIAVRVHVKYPGTDKRTLVFTPGSITLKDDSGHTYAPVYGDKKSGCKKDDIGASHKLDIAPMGEVTLASVSAEKTAEWCAENPGSAIPLFTGPVEKNAKKLEVQLNGVGPFMGFQIEIDL